MLSKGRELDRGGSRSAEYKGSSQSSTQHDHYSCYSSPLFSQRKRELAQLTICAALRIRPLRNQTDTQLRDGEVVKRSQTVQLANSNLGVAPGSNPTGYSTFVHRLILF
jgi:hypothetical protein